MSQNALVLFAHGSRNAAWRTPFEMIAAKVRANTDVQVELAFLELMAPTLPDVLRGLADDGVANITIVPLFFGLGNHVAHDLGELTAAFLRKYPQVKITTAAPLGESDMVLDAMAGYALSVASSAA